MSGIVRGPDGVLHYEDIPATLLEVLGAREADSADVEALVVPGGERLTFAELARRAREVAAGLQAAGVGHGDRVAILLDNGAAWVLAYWGAVLSGAIAVPVNTRLTAPEIESTLDECRPAVVLRTPADLPRGAEADYRAPEVGPDDIAAIFFTSGTTGKPKGVCQKHSQVVANCENFRRILLAALGDPARSRGLISVPLFHVTGCNAQLLVSHYVGGTAVVMPSFDIGSFLDVLVAERIDLVISVPTIYSRVIADPRFASVDTSGVRAALYGGAPSPPELVGRIAQAFPNAWLGNGFGSTEAVGVLTLLPHRFAVSHADSVGEAVPVVELRIDDPDEHGVGELLARGSSVSGWYWEDPERTAAGRTDGWLRTGDLARIDDGLVVIVDRIKDMISRGGEKVFCGEVENVLATAPGVVECAVFGVPDADLGERVAAMVVAVPGSEPETEALLTLLQEALAPYKIPEFIVVGTQPLVRNAGGKLLKARLRESVDWTEVPRLIRRRSPAASAG